MRTSDAILVCIRFIHNMLRRREGGGRRRKRRRRRRRRRKVYSKLTQ